MNRILTFEIKDIPPEVWGFLVNLKGSEEAADALIEEMITEKLVVAITSFYKIMQAQKAGIPLETMVSRVVDDMVEGFDDGALKDETILAAEKHVHRIIDKIKEKDEEPQ